MFLLVSLAEHSITHVEELHDTLVQVKVFSTFEQIRVSRVRGCLEERKRKRENALGRKRCVNYGQELQHKPPT